MIAFTRTLLLLLGVLIFFSNKTGQVANRKSVAHQESNEVLLSETENAYNPIPSPDGSMVAYVRTGRWDRGSGGLGRSNLRSEVMVMNRKGRLLTERPLADTFLAGWTADSKNLICYRSWKYFLVSLDGKRSKGIHLPYEMWSSHNFSERGTYFPSVDAVIFVQHIYSNYKLTGGAIRTIEEEISRNRKSYLGEMLVPSPDGRYIAAIDVMTWADNQLWVYDTQNKSWSNLGKATVHPDISGPGSTWDWMGATWNPWFADSSHLAFISGSSIVISTPDGKDRRTVMKPTGAIGLATPSPDGKSVAYVTFDAEVNKEQPHWTFWGNTTIWVAPAVAEATARPVTKKSPETTYCLRWLNPYELVFDRLPHEPFTNRARLWKVRID